MVLFSTLSRWHYILLGYLLLPFLFFFAAVKAYKRGETIGEFLFRFGFFRSAIPKNPVHIHAVSLGEVTSAVPLVELLLAEEPNTPILFTAMTKTGLDHIKHKFGTRVVARYLPFDIDINIYRFVKRVKPRALILVELELWPNLLHHCKRNNVPVALVNGRMTDSSCSGYGRFPGFIKTTLSSIRFAMVQSDQDKANYVKLGMDEKNVQVTGSIKFDTPVIGNSQHSGIEIQNNGRTQRKVLIAGSTHLEDENAVLAAFENIRTSFADSLLIIAPRKLERVENICSRLQESGYVVCKMSKSKIVPLHCDVYVIDTFGDLQAAYGVADVAFVGGSIANKGGHNPLEAVVQEVPVLMGQNLQNCRAIVERLLDNQAISVVSSSKQLSDVTVGLFKDQSVARQMADRALRVVTDGKGGSESCFRAIQAIINP